MLPIPFQPILNKEYADILQVWKIVIFRGGNLKEKSKILKGFATFWEFSFYGQKKVADYELHSLFAEKIHFHT